MRLHDLIENAFWSGKGEARYGRYHSANSKHTKYSRDVLFVYVHGYLATSCTRRWQLLPLRLQAQCGIRADAVAFRYPWLPWHECDLDREAEMLRSLLNDNYRDHRHIFFVTHSTGALVVAAALRKDWEEWRDEESTIPRLLWRTRHLFHCSGAHAGASRWLSYAVLKPVNALNFLLHPVLILRNAFPQEQRYGWGRSQLYAQLQMRSQWTKTLAADLNRAEGELREAGLPWPAVYDFPASSEIVVAPEKDKLRTAIRRVVRKTHTELVTQGEASKIVRLASIFLKNHRKIAATETVRRVRRLEELDRIAGLLSPQKDAGELIRHAFRETPRPVVVTGDAGTGKSVLIRRLAEEFSSRCLASGDAMRNGELFPIVIPLNLVELDDVTEQLAWGDIAAWWSAWVDKGLHSETGRDKSEVTAERESWRAWLASEIYERNIVLFLDGADELIGRNLFVDHNELRGVLKQLRSDASKLYLVLGIRKSSEVARYGGSDGLIVEVRAPDRLEAEAVYPRARELLEKTKADQRLEQLLLTPLYLIPLLEGLDKLPDAPLTSRLNVLQLAIESLFRRRDSASRQYAISDEINAAMVVAFALFARWRPAMTAVDIRADCKELWGGWKRHLERARTFADGNRMDLRLQAVEVARGMRIVVSRAGLHALLESTVFFPAGAGKYRVRHDMWQTYLIAKYLACAVLSGFAPPLQFRGFNIDIYHFVGLMLGDVEIAPELLKQLVNYSQAADDESAIANVAAIIGNSGCKLSDPALQILVSRLHSCQDATSHVTLSSLGHRGLRDAPSDGSADRMRQIIIAEAEAAVAGGQRNRVTTSVLWCYAQAYIRQGIGVSHILRFESSEESPPEIVAEMGVEDALQLSNPPVHNHTRKSGLQLSVQVGFYRVLEIAAWESSFLIPATHYMYCLAAAAHTGQLLDADVRAGLNQFLGPNSKLADRIEASDSPELVLLLKASRDLAQSSAVNGKTRTMTCVVVKTPGQ